MKKFLILAIIFIIIMIKVVYDTRAVEVKYISYETDKLATAENISILQISDVHNRNLNGKYEEITNLNPDMIVLTGDLIDRTTTDLTYTDQFLKQLVMMERPIYFVSGNHEQESPIFKDLKRLLTDYEVIQLENRHVTIEVNDVEINLAGVANQSTDHARLASALEQLDDKLPTILLSHTPITPDESIDLILSGHTHGGQVRLPFIGALIAPDQGFFPKYDKGLYQLDSGATLYIDSGLGTSFLPIRFLNKAQISMITIKSDEDVVTK